MERQKNHRMDRQEMQDEIERLNEGRLNSCIYLISYMPPVSLSVCLSLLLLIHYGRRRTIRV